MGQGYSADTQSFRADTALFTADGAGPLVTPGIGKVALPQVFQRTPISGFRYSRPPDTTPPTPPTVQNITPSNTSITVGWTNGIDPDSGILSTRVEISPNGVGVWTTVDVDSSVLNVILPPTGVLTAGTAYDIRLRCTNGAGLLSSYTAIQTVTTLGSNPALEPGRLDIATGAVAVQSGGTISVPVSRTGAGVNAPGISVDWQVTGGAQAVCVPANGTLTWAAGDNADKIIQIQCGSVSQTVLGAIGLLSPAATTGTLVPSIGQASVSITIQAISAATTLKFIPGHMSMSNSLTYPDDHKRSLQLSELGKVSNNPLIKAYQPLYLTSIFGGPTVWDFSFIFRDLNVVRTMTPPRGLIAALNPTIFGQGKSPQFIAPSGVTSDAGNGPSPIVGSYGWWGVNGGTATALAWWRQAVMDSFVIPMFQAMAAAVNPSTGLTLNNDPYFLGVAWGETSISIDSGDSTFSFANVCAQYKRLITAHRAAFTKTLLYVDNNLSASGSPTGLGEDLAQFTFDNKCVLSGPDTVPLKYFAALRWLLGSSGPDYVVNGVHSRPYDVLPDRRGIAMYVCQTQEPDLDQGKTGPATPYTLYDWVDKTLQQTQMIWGMVSLGATDPPIPAYPQIGYKNTGTNPGNWNSCEQVINNNTLTHIAKPSSIP